MSGVPRFNLALLALAAAQLASATLGGAEVSAVAEVSSPAVMVGESAEYTVTFRNTTRIPNMHTPRVEGIDFSDSMSTSSYRQIINGRITTETRASWSFRATRTGAFTVPGRTVRIDGQDVAIPPVRFEAVPMDEETRSRAFLRLEIPDGPFYVGQAVPARIGLYIRSDISVSNISFPQRVGDAFLNSPFDNNPQRGRTRIEGRVHEAFVWDFILNPIKSGATELRFSQDLVVQISSPDDRFPSIFSMSRSRSEPLTVFSDTLQIEVLSLPESTRPDAFHGAIGDFTITADLSSRELRVGEPITLTLSVEGAGNFDRIGPPQIPDWENWRLYPPKTEFVPSDARGLTGRKSFEYILIPQSPEITEVPELAYASFDPQSGQYQTTRIEPVPVNVQAAAIPDSGGQLFLDPADAASGQRRVPDALLPIRANPGRLLGHESGWRHPSFWSIQLLAAGLLLGLRLWQGRRRRLSSDQRLARRHVGGRKVRKQLQQARAAAQAGDPAPFYAALRAAVQERVSHFSASPVEAKTLVSSDCLDILSRCNLPDGTLDMCTRLLNAADSHQFAGAKPAPDKLARDLDELSTLISDLNRLQK
jgi:hypothetical protein